MKLDLGATRLHACSITITVVFGIIPKMLYGYDQKWDTIQRRGIRSDATFSFLQAVTY